jgi:hypothetical protein
MYFTLNSGYRALHFGFGRLFVTGVVVVILGNRDLTGPILGEST